MGVVMIRFEFGHPNWNPRYGWIHNPSARSHELPSLLSNAARRSADEITTRAQHAARRQCSC